jgi:hypothetical protein
MKILVSLTIAINICSVAAVCADTNAFGFNRIMPGWTNYSTAFSTTHDASENGEFATVASFYTPAIDAAPFEFGAIVIWFSADGGAVNFADFTFKVCVWSGLDAFIRDARVGDLATYTFATPTGGTEVPDTTTRGGRPAYHLRFSVPGPELVLTQCHTYLVGLVAVAASSRSGELFVPTAPFEGESDVQAGNIVPFGWTYLFNAGGSTIYSGQLATELRVRPIGEMPRLTVERRNGEIRVTWAPPAPCYVLQAAEELNADAWLPATDAFGDLSQTAGGRFFRLVKESASKFVR